MLHRPTHTRRTGRRPWETRVPVTLAIAAALMVALVSPQAANATDTDSRDGTAAKPHTKIAPPSGAGVQACYPISAHFTSRHSQNPGGWGCAITPVYNYQNGQYQRFVNGEMDWSPSQGPNMVVSGLKYTDNIGRRMIWFQLGSSFHYNYDSWLIRVTRNGVLHQPQNECRATTNWPDGSFCTRYDGGLHIVTTGSGSYRIITEGCDIDFWGNHTCNEGWTIPVDLQF